MNKTFSYRLNELLNKEDQDEKLLFDRVKDLISQYDFKEDFEDGTASIYDLYTDFIQCNGDFDQGQPINCDFEELDNQHLFRRGEFVVIGGRPAMGKSQFMVNLAMNISINQPVLYVSFDQSKLALTRRMISSMIEIDVSMTCQGSLNELQLKLLKGVEKEFANRKLYINDTSNSSVSNVRDICRLHIERNGVQVIFIDYLQLLSSERYRNQREMEISYICRTLKQIARENNVLVIAASQLSRNVEIRGGDKRPILSDLRESGAIEQDADKVFFLYRPEYYGFTMDEMGNSNLGMCELMMAKNRNGHVDNFRFQWNENFTRMMTLADHLDQFRINSERLSELDEDDNPF